MHHSHALNAQAHKPRAVRCTHYQAALSTPGLRSPLPHLHRDCAHRCHICTGTALTAATSAPGLRSTLPHLRRDWAGTLQPAGQHLRWHFTPRRIQHTCICVYASEHRAAVMSRARLLSSLKHDEWGGELAFLYMDNAPCKRGNPTRMCAPMSAAVAHDLPSTEQALQPLLGRLRRKVRFRRHAACMLPVWATATKRSVCRQSIAGTWITSTTFATSST